MSKVLESMERKGWRLCKRWFDFDSKHEPTVRFVKYLEPLMPSELADRIVDDSDHRIPLLLASPMCGEPGPSLKPYPSLSFGANPVLSRLVREAVPVYVKLSVTESELKELEEGVSKKVREVKKELFSIAEIISPKEVSKTIPLSTDEKPPSHWDKPLSFDDREKLNKKLMKANL